MILVPTKIRCSPLVDAFVVGAAAAVAAARVGRAMSCAASKSKILNQQAIKPLFDKFRSLYRGGGGLLSEKEKLQGKVKEVEVSKSELSKILFTYFSPRLRRSLLQTGRVLSSG